MHLARYIGAVSPPFSAVPSLAPFVRQSIASLTPAQIVSLQHGIAVMMSRPVSDPTSYSFQANIHGTYDTPFTSQEMGSWNNCEHGSYHFLSWHRMYLYFFDRILRAAAGDPQLVLPYWNWTDPAQRTLPAPFRQPANTSNALYIAPPGRPSALDSGSASLGAGTVDYSAAFTDTNFDWPSGSGASFGGQIAAPMQFNSPHGAFESQPHDVVHVALGGLMSDPDTAAQDPIFWLHHANIDRMWNRWLAQGGGRGDPSDAAWLNQQFTFYDEAGHAVFLTGAEVEDTVGQLNYRYDDDPLTLHGRLPRVALVTEFEPRVLPAAPTGSRVASVPLRVLAQTLPAVSGHAIELAGKTERIEVPLTEAASTRMRALAVSRESSGAIALRLADIRYEKSSGVYYEVYVNPPAGEARTSILRVTSEIWRCSD
jgi:tyrosinase